MRKLIGKLRQLKRSIPALMARRDTNRRLASARHSRSQQEFAKTLPQEIERRELINRLTNWQRSQWAKAGYPGDLDVINKYANMQRR